MIKNLDEIIKPSKGTELLQSLQEQSNTTDIGIYDSSIKIEEKTPDEPADINKDGYKGSIINGVEVVDVKAIEKQIPKRKIDKFGIPINPGEHRNFDKI